jgi:hypothetical protein
VESEEPHEPTGVTVAKHYVLRVWLPDRPGALGQVASRIGAVRGSVVAIDILERDGGQAVDELTVELPDATPLALLVDEVRQADGVQVEEVRPAAGPHDPRLDALEGVAQVVEVALAVLVATALALLVLSLFDVAYQRWEYEQRPAVRRRLPAV